MIMDSAKNVIWIISFKKFGRLKVNERYMRTVIMSTVNGLSFPPPYKFYKQKQTITKLCS